MTTPAATSREWTVTGMDCGACASKVRGAVERLPGVSDVEVGLMAERLRLRLDGAQTPPEDIEASVKRLGFGIAPRGAPVTRKRPFVMPGDALGQPDPAPAPDADPQPDPASPAWWQTGKGRLLIGTGVLLCLAWGVQIAFGGPVAQAAFITATLAGIVPIARRATEMALARQPFTIEMLMTIAATGALAIGEAQEAALVVFLFALGEMLERVAAGRARSGIRALARLVPRTALREIAGAVHSVAADSLTPGDVVHVRPGDRLPCDGDVLDGQSGVDESPVTGESMPVLKAPGSGVFAGTVNTDALLRIRVTKAPRDNTIARILRLVEDAEAARAPTERFIDRFSRWYMPMVVGAAILTALIPPLATGAGWETWIYRALALLLIGCPCALVISVPASIASALAAGARHGLLMKGGVVIERAAAVTCVAFDKTGTLTLGTPRVTDVIAAARPAAEVLRLASAVEAGSSHPIAAAILSHAGDVPPPAQDARALPGLGAEAMLNDTRITVAAPRLAAERATLGAQVQASIAALEDQGKTVVVVLHGADAAGLIALRDTPRPDAAAAIADLRRMGIASVMLTGDNARTATAIAGPLGLDHLAGLLPGDKVDALRARAKDGPVMMVGDGINDAPAMAAAHVGVAMGSGTDVALETAQAAILRNRVEDVPAMIRLARAAMANIHQNIAIALGLKAVFLVTTLTGVTGLWIAILADTGATVLVTLNALRLMRYDPEVVPAPRGSRPGSQGTSAA